MKTQKFLENGPAKETSKLLCNAHTINDMGSIQKNEQFGTFPPPSLSLGQFKIYNYLYWIYASVFYCLAAYFQMTISPITDVLQTELNTSSSGIGMLSSTYNLTNFLFQLPFGVILQRYSHHMVLLVVSICLTICFVLFAFMDSLVSGCIIRSVCGIFGACTWIIIPNIVGQHFGNNKVSLFLGITLFVTEFIWLFGLTIQGYIYQTYHVWRATYYFIALIAIISVSAVALTMYTQKRTIQKNELIAADVSWLNLSNGTQQGNIKQNKTSFQLKMVMGNYLNICAACYLFASWALMTSICGLWLIPYLMVKFKYSRSLSSLFSGMFQGGVGAGNLIFGYFATKYRNRKIYLIICDLCFSALLYLLYLDKEILNQYAVIIIIILCGFGGASNGVLFTLIREYNVTADCQETAMGFVSAVQTSAGFLSQYVIGLLIDYHWQHAHNNNGHRATRTYNVDDYTFAFSCVGPACLTVMVITTALLKETNAKNI